MDEKKLTDEEIVKALECCSEHDDCFDCPIMGEMKRRNFICREVVLDLIHRLKDENERLMERVFDCTAVIEYNEKCSKEIQAATILLEQRNKEIAEQKEEIERLTEEKWQVQDDLDNYHEMNKELEKRNAELQKQVDELKEELDLANETIDRNKKRYEKVSIECQKAWKRVDILEDNLLDKIRRNEELIALIKQAEQQAVKDTVKEILTDAKKWVKEHYKDKITDSFGEREMLFMEAFGCLLAYLKDKHGVEVE